MNTGNIVIYCGDGRGKTTAAIGQGLIAIGEGKEVIMVRFLDGNKTAELMPLQRFEPEFKVFRFARQREEGELATHQEVMTELTTAYQFSKKLLETGECDMLILDGILDAVAAGYVNDRELAELLESRPAYLQVLMTGETATSCLQLAADCIYRIQTEKELAE